LFNTSVVRDQRPESRVILPSSPQHPPARRLFLWQAALAVAALMGVGSIAGCREEEQIRTYDVPKVPDRGIQTVLPGAPGRSIGVLLPAGDATWSFKVGGPTVFVSKHVKAIREFIESVRLEGGVPKYDIPAGWREEDGGEPPGAPPRYKTLIIDTSSSPRVELAVSKLNAGMDLAANVHRWRGLLKMEEVNDEDAIKDVKSVITAAGPAYWVDLEGIYSPNAMGRPARGGMAGATPGGSAAKLPPDHPPISMPNVQQGAAPVLSRTAPLGAPVKYEAPAEWTPVPPAMFAIASFQFVDGEKQVLISVTHTGGELIENVNRWRSDQLGLPKIDAAGLQTAITKMTIGDRPGDYLELSGQPAGKPTAIYVGMVPVTDGTWFLKLSGDPELAQSQRANYHKFLSTFRVVRELGRAKVE
jgi:hypothetical protein